MIPILVLFVTATILNPVSALCELSVQDKNKLYSYSLTTPLRHFPHGILSEDGFYKVGANGTVLWFQLCGSMIFNHDPPMCVDCKLESRNISLGQSRCGMGCSALVSNKIEGYPVCTTLGHHSSTFVDVLDKNSPHMGIVVKMTKSGPKHNCSLSQLNATPMDFLYDYVLISYDGPSTLETVGYCDYTTELKHPCGCAKIISSHGKGLGWFGNFMIILLCLFGVYFVGGASYRYFHLHIRGIDVIPNLELWASLPHRIQSLFASLMWRFRGPSQRYTSSYSPVNF